MMLTKCVMDLFMEWCIVLQIKELQKYYSNMPRLIDLVHKCLQVAATLSVVGYL